MPKATSVPSTPPRAAPEAREPDISPAIARMREIAAQAADALLLADGPVHPDHKLLDLCGDALHHLKAAERLHRQCDEIIFGGPGRPSEADYAKAEAVRAACEASVQEAKQRMRAAKKLRAVTPAGIYAKAMVVKFSATGATVLARSLSEDLVNSRELRETLWPAAAGVGDGGAQ